MSAPSEFNSDWYLAHSLDVAESGIDAYEHFLAFGLDEGRTTDTYNETSYLARYPDVSAAVDAGGFSSGWQHFITFGSDEGRDASGPIYVQGASSDDVFSVAGFSSGSTIKGFDGSDSLTGGPGDDLIYGNRNTDYIFGGGGNDTLYGGQNDGPADGDGVFRMGADTLSGGDGDDLIYGNHGGDMIHAGAIDGRDTIYGGQDDDTIYGSDYGLIYGNLGDDSISTLHYGGGDATVYGGGGADTLTPGGTSAVGSVHWNDFNPDEGDRISDDALDSYASSWSFDSASGPLHMSDPLIRAEVTVYLGRSDFNADWIV